MPARPSPATTRCVRLRDESGAARAVERVARNAILVPTMRKLASLALVLLLAAGVLACRPRLVVRLTTLVYQDGSLDRRLEILGRTADGEVPADDDWLESRAGIALAEPDAWKRIERGPGRLRAEGFFLGADELPPLFTIETASGVKPARTRTLLDVEDRLLLERWTWVERHGDPYDATETAAALDALTELAVEALTAELRSEFGEGLDAAPAERFLRNDARALAQALLTVNRSLPGWDRTADRHERWSRVLKQYGVGAVPHDDSDEYWEIQLPVIFEWGRKRVAAALSTPEVAIVPDDLGFWPPADDIEDGLTGIVSRVWDSEEELFAEVEPHLAALAGYYGGDDAPRFRFECRLRLPGTLLATNGTADGEDVVWLFREPDLVFGEVGLRARTVQLRTDNLVALGARRDFDRMSLLRLADLLWKRDPEGALRDAVARAIDRGSLDPLRDKDAVPEQLLPIAEELADLLDPTHPLE